MLETPPADRRGVRVVRWLRESWGIVAAGAFGALWFLGCGARLVNPFDVETLLIDDWSTHLLGWLFFRHEPFHLPFGRIDGLLHPVGTTVGYTDSIPWMAAVFRPLSWALPADFQYIGLFILACFVLNGVAGAWVVRAVSPRPLHQALGGILFALVPELLQRVGHPSLCAQGLLLIPFGLALRKADDPRQARRMASAALAVCVIAAGLHPYLAAMMLAVAAAVPLKLWLVDKQLSWRWALGVLVVMPLSMVLVFAFFGYFLGGVERGGHGFGGFSADLGTFVNPLDFSRWLSPKPQGGLQYEGFAYLGVGVFTALGLAVVSLFIRFRDARALPYRRLAFFVPGVLATAIFSLATPWTLFGQTVLDLGALYARLPAGLIGPFRSSGRFIWPLMYALVAFGVVTLVRLWRHIPAVPAVLLAICIGLQLGDVTTAPVTARFKPAALHRFTSPAWKAVDGKYAHLKLVPAEIWSVCGGRAGYRHTLVIGGAYHAYLHGLTFNSGYVARASVEQPTVCQQEEARVLRGELDPTTIYLVWPDQAQALLQHGASCGFLDGVIACVRPAADDDFARSLRASAGR